MILLWDVDSGLAQFDKYVHSNDNHVVAGALLGVGILNCHIKHDLDPVSVLYLVQYNVCVFVFVCLFISMLDFIWFFLRL